MKILLRSLCCFLLIPLLNQADSLTNPPAPPPVPGISSSPQNKLSLSPKEWQELRMDRAQALKANPALVANASALSQKLRAFQQKLNAAMVKTDPNIGLVLAKFSASRPPLRSAAPPPPKP